MKKSKPPKRSDQQRRSTQPSTVPRHEFGNRSLHRRDSEKFRVVELLAIDEDGFGTASLVEPIQLRAGKPKSAAIKSKSYRLLPQAAGSRLAKIGDRLLISVQSAREAKIIHILPPVTNSILGLFEKTERGGKITPTDRRDRQQWFVDPENINGAKAGEIVAAIPLGGSTALPIKHRQSSTMPAASLPRAKITERLGLLGAAGSISLLSVRSHAIPHQFSDTTMVEAESVAAEPLALGNRKDYRQTPLVTIDGADARDFDDAVFAEPDETPTNSGGFRLIVAIADVAHFVRTNSPLDLEARERGNSVYFPDLVVPMLPEALSNGCCSLVPHQERAAMVAELRIDKNGQLIERQFFRGLMKSVARLTYVEVQAAKDGFPNAVTQPLIQSVITPLYAAFHCLSKARANRGTLDLNLPERQVTIDRDSGAVLAIGIRPRLDAHRLIEEFMILANVAAAEVLEQAAIKNAKLPIVYRIHDLPSQAKFAALIETLSGFGIKITKGQKPQPQVFERILRQVIDKPEAELVNNLILRSLAQAAYSIENIGHFGLALPRYCHFTSPIRRYADLLVHRSLIQCLKLSDHPATDEIDSPHFEESKQQLELNQYGAICQAINACERRAIDAERSANDRYMASYMAAHRGASFQATISSVTKFGLFICLSETGAEGLLPMRHLPRDFYIVDEKRQELRGEKYGAKFQIGAHQTVILEEVEIATGRLLFSLSNHD